MFKPSIYNIVHDAQNGKKFLYNSKSNASIELEKDFDCSFLNDINKFYELPEQQKTLLIQNGFFVEQNRDELAEVNYLFNANYFKDSILNVVLVPTLKCNFNCPYCFEKGHESIAERKDYFDVLKNYSQKFFKHKTDVQISLFGGEPLVMADKMFDYLDFVLNDSIKNDYRFSTTITTNGSLLNEDVINKLIKYHLSSLQITLDGNRESHNKTRIFHNGNPSYDLLIKNIKLFLDMTRGMDIIFYLRINLINRTPEAIKEILEEFEDKYRSQINLLIRPVYNTKEYKKSNTNNKEELEQFYNIAQEMGFKINKNSYKFQTCEAGADAKFFYLMPDLTMWKCINDTSFKEACIGKMNEDGSLDINSQNVIRWHNAANCFNDEKCTKCPKLPNCYGGCILYKLKNNKRNCKSFDMACLPNCTKD